MSTVRVLQQARRLKVAPALEHARTLGDELLKFEVKISDAGRDTYGTWREGAHDDLVLAVALALWWGERLRPQPARPHEKQAWAPAKMAWG